MSHIARRITELSDKQLWEMDFDTLYMVDPFADKRESLKRNTPKALRDSRYSFGMKFGIKSNTFCNNKEVRHE